MGAARGERRPREEKKSRGHGASDRGDRSKGEHREHRSDRRARHEREQAHSGPSADHADNGAAQGDARPGHEKKDKEWNDWTAEEQDKWYRVVLKNYEKDRSAH